MVVAATVHVSQDGTRLTLRQTTLLPLLPGLPALLCLLFAPQAELRTDVYQENLTGGLFGLGANSKDRYRPYFQEHDIELPFDTQITNQDVFNVSISIIFFN
jgi:ATP-dependent RNA helicase TDRD9